MNSHPYPRINPGDSFDAMPSAAWNRLMEMAEWYDRTVRLGTNQEPKPPKFRACNAIHIKNATEVDLDVGDIVAINGSVYDPAEPNDFGSFAFAPILIGTTPEIPTDYGRFAVLLEPIQADGVGYAAISGMVYCTVDMDFQERPFADIDGTTGKLKGYEFGGAEILYIEDMNEDPEEWEAGTKEALVRIGAFNAPDLIVSFSGPLGAGDSPVTANVHDAGGSSVRTISLYGSVAVSNDIDLLTIPPGFAFAKFHREAGVYELGMNTSVQMDAPPP
jgi:hypothetical protein